MKKGNKQDLIFLGCITVFLVLYILIITKFGTYFYGSTLDWNTQHYVIPDYFRKLFYQTKNLFPSFAPHLGNGQNIYNLSYYGLLNPIILISYALPFISMRTYIQISSILLIYLSIILLYKWLKNKFDFKIAAISTIIFTLSSPILFHSHRHIMFVNYIPFTIMGLIATDKYFKTNKKSSLILSVFLITSTSYYFSISAIAALIVYGIYVYINKNKKITINNFLKDGTKFLLPIIIGVLISSVLLIPTFISLLSGRAEGTTAISLAKLFFPNNDIETFLHNYQSLGITTSIIFSLIYGVINYKEEKRFLSISLLMLIVFPIFMYILNGTLYISGKALIPFLPLYIYLFAHFLKDALNHKYKLTSTTIIFILFCIFELIFNKNNFLFLYDIILTFVAILLLYNKRQKKFFPLLIIIICSVSFISYNQKEELVSKKSITETNEMQQLVKYIQETDQSFYRIADRDGGLADANNVINIDTYKTSIYSSLTNKEYRQFYYDSFGNDILNRSRGQLSTPKNLMFNIYFGNKYIISNKNNNTLGYKLLKELDEKALYLNELAYPIGYSTNKLMSYNEYSSLKYPYNIEALMNYTIVNNAAKSNYQTNIEKIELSYYQTYYNLNLKNNGEYIEIDSNTNGKINLNLKNTFSNKILFIRFDLLDSNPCNIGDNVISINGITNKLTCKTWKYYNNNTSFEYTIAEKDLNNLEIIFAEGIYKISNIEVYALDYNKFTKNINNYNPFNIDKNKTKGDIIEGSINALEDGYFNISIPYDKGFSIYIDDQKVKHEKTNLSFIGFKISKGMHNIKIVYSAPLQKISKIISFIGVLIFMFISFNEQKKKVG